MKINFQPPMTGLLASRRVFRDDPFVLVDVGALGGIGRHYEAFGEDMRVVAFEPNEEECRRLQANGDRRVTYLPLGLGGRDESRTLYVTYIPSSSTLFRPNQSFFDRLIVEKITEVIGEETIRLTTLDAALKDMGDIDFIKLDAEGAELDIMKASKKVLSAPGLLGIFTEIRWHRAMGTPIFSEVDLFVREFGYELYDLALGRTSRKALPYPLTWDFRHDTRRDERIMGGTALGQVLGGDALYLRDLAATPNLKPTKILKMACLMEIFEQCDSAAELLQANHSVLQGIVDVRELLNALTPAVAGRDVSYDEYVRQYFADDFGFRPSGNTASESAESSPRPDSVIDSVGRFFRSFVR
jgi:FkbM family methyltransferase